MIVSRSEAETSLAHPKKPDWFMDEPGSIADTLLVAAIAAVLGFIVGLFFAFLADGLWVNGFGFDGAAEMMNGRQAAWYMASIPVAAVTGTLLYREILSRTLFKRTYFSTHQHRSAYQELHRLPAEARLHARDAYEAVAGFKSEPQKWASTWDASSDGINPEWKVFDRANEVWDETYQKLSRMYRDDVDAQIHRDRLNAAEETLKTLK